MTKVINFLALAFFILLTSCSSQEPVKGELSWFTNLEEAKAEAQIWKRPIFIDFTGSDWCGWCVALEKQVFSQPEFIEYAKKELILVELDFPKKSQQSKQVKKYNNEIAAKYEIKNFPTILLLDMNGDEIARTGYKFGGAAEYVKHIQELVRKQ